MRNLFRKQVHTLHPALALLVCLTSFFPFMTQARADCDISGIREKYAESKNNYKYRHREKLRPEIARLSDECAEELGDGDILEIVGLAYEYGIFDETQPLAKRLLTMEMTAISDAAFAHAVYSNDEEFLLRLMKLQMKLLREKENSYVDYKRDANKANIARYMNTVNGYEEKIALKRRALGWLIMCYGDFEAAINEYEIVMEDQPNFWLTPAQLGTRYLETGDLDRAEFFSKYSLSRRDGARAYSNLVRISILEENYDDAERYADKLEDISEGYFNLEWGRLEFFLGNYREAYNSFKSFFDTAPCVSKDWNHAPLFEAVNLLGKLLDEKEDFPGEDFLSETAAALEAEEDFRAAAPYYYLLTLINPHNPDYYYHLGQCNENPGLHYSAVRAYSLHLYFAPDSPNAPEIQEYFDSRMIDYDMLEE